MGRGRPKRQPEEPEEMLERLTRSFDRNAFGDELLKRLGGEGELAQTLVDSLKSEKTSSGARAGINRLILDVLNEKQDSGEDIGEVPPAERLEAMVDLFLPEYKQKIIAEYQLECLTNGCPRCRHTVETDLAENSELDKDDESAEGEPQLPVCESPEAVCGDPGGSDPAVRADGDAAGSHPV